ncbi:MAG: hypothetical protein WC599_14395, partial [Bacteroidales bacterium]
MKKNNLLLVLFLLILIPNTFIYSQTYILNANLGTITGCSGRLYDSGGPTGNYSANQNYTVTFCSGTGDPMQFNITALAVSNGDHLIIYDGPNTGSPVLYDWTNYTLAAGYYIPYTSSGTCITIQFTSNANQNNDGFEADVFCYIAPIPPANDNCNNATTLTIGQSCNFSQYTNSYATQSATTPFPTCGAFTTANVCEDVWFKVVAPASGNVSIDVEQGSPVASLADADMAVYSGNCGSLTQIACDDFSGLGLNPSINLTGLTPGNTYYIRIWEYGCDAVGIFDICAFTPTPPANDNPCNAVPITVGPVCGMNQFSNENATASPGVPAPGCAGYSNGDVWFTAVVPSSGNLIIDSDDNRVIIDGGMAAYRGTCSVLTLIQCDDNASANGTMPMLNLTGLTPGETIWIRFWENGNNNNGTFDLCVYTPTTMPSCATTDPADDHCYNATDICNLTGYCGTTSDVYTVSEIPSSFCGSVENNSWLSFVANETSATLTV